MSIAFEQPYAQFRLKHRDASAEGRLRDIASGCRTREVQFFG